LPLKGGAATASIKPESRFEDTDVRQHAADPETREALLAADRATPFGALDQLAEARVEAVARLRQRRP
jgi:hypothetical protein